MSVIIIAMSRGAVSADAGANKRDVPGQRHKLRHPPLQATRAGNALMCTNDIGVSNLNGRDPF